LEDRLEEISELVEEASTIEKYFPAKILETKSNLRALIN